MLTAHKRIVIIMNLTLVLDDNYFPPEIQVFRGKFMVTSKEVKSIMDEFNKLDLGGEVFEDIRLKRTVNQIDKLFGCKRITIKDNK